MENVASSWSSLGRRTAKRWTPISMVTSSLLVYWADLSALCRGLKPTTAVLTRPWVSGDTDTILHSLKPCLPRLLLYMMCPMSPTRTDLNSCFQVARGSISGKAWASQSWNQASTTSTWCPKALLMARSSGREARAEASGRCRQARPRRMSEGVMERKSSLEVRRTAMGRRLMMLATSRNNVSRLLKSMGSVLFSWWARVWRASLMQTSACPARQEQPLGVNTQVVPFLPAASANEFRLSASAPAYATICGP